MRIQPLQREKLSPEIRYVHDEITSLVSNNKSQVNMLNTEGALLGPFPAMLQHPQFGVPALAFLRSLDVHATLPAKVREVAILTVGSALGARFELYAHEIMAEAFGISRPIIATLSAGGRPFGLSDHEAIAHDIARVLITGHIVPDATYKQAVRLFGKEGVAELFFLISGYSLIATILNGFDIPAPDSTE